MAYSTIFSNIHIGKCKIDNRVVMSPMHLGLANIDGTLSEPLMNYYEERAKGGVGLIITEIVRVEDSHGATSFMQPGLSHDYQIPGWKDFSERIHRHGTKLFAQLHHPGRQNLGIMINTLPITIFAAKIWPSFPKLLFRMAPTLGEILNKKQLTFSSVAPSKCEMSRHALSRVRALSNKQVKQLVTKFIQAASRAQQAGLDGVELHAGHGYLLNQFLSPNTNFRTDEYGGCFENRLRFLSEIITGIKNKCGCDFPVVVRLTVDEFYDKIGLAGKGYKLEQGLKYAKALEEMGIDAIDVTSANYDTYNYWLEPARFTNGWRAYLAQAVKQHVTIPVIAANLIRSAEQAERQLQQNIQDLISLGRPLIADAHWVSKVKNNRQDEIKRCIGCLNCMQTTFDGAFYGNHGYCSVNPTIGMEAIYYHLPNDGNRRSVVIIGAGVAGLTCAEILAKRNFDVNVLEKDDVAGGQIRVAAKPPGKDRIAWVAADLTNNATKSGATVRYSVSANVDSVAKYHPYAVIIATGGEAAKSSFIRGSDKSNVYTTTEVLNGEVNLAEQRVVVVGSGMTGLETAEFLCQSNALVSIVELDDNIAPNTWHQLKDDILPELEKSNVRFITSSKLIEVTDTGIIVSHTKHGYLTEIICDSVVLAMGSKSVNILVEEMKKNFTNVFVIGDAKQIGNIAQATKSAFDVAVNNV